MSHFHKKDDRPLRHFDDADDSALCDDIHCHCEDEIDWDAEDARQAGWNLIFHTANCVGESLEMTCPDSDGSWSISIDCDPTGRHPGLEPQTLNPQPCLEVDLEDRRKNVKELVENLKRRRVSEFKDCYEDAYGGWTITARWSGTLVNDPRWLVSAGQIVQ
jgi:hypothetical protein